MKILVKTNKMERKEWLKWRCMGIGGSDASVIAGVNKYKSIFQLWMEKTGQAEPEEGESEYTHFGTVLEPVVKREFTRRTGLKVRNKRAILQSGEHPFMLADLDGVVKEGGETCIFEAKTASAYKQDLWEEGVPLEYLYQVQHYMAVTGAGKAHVAALVGGNHFICHEISRDEEMIGGIIRMEKEFWEGCVLSGREPLADGSKATTEYFNRKYHKSNGKAITLPAEAVPLIGQYKDVSSRLKELEAEKNAVLNRMKSYLKDNESGTAGEHRISWKEVPYTSFDKKRLEQENREIYEKYCRKGSCRRLTVA